MVPAVTLLPRAQREYEHIRRKISKRDRLIVRSLLNSKDKTYHTILVYSTDLYGFSFVAKPNPNNPWSEYVIDRHDRRGRFDIQPLYKPLVPLLYRWEYGYLETDEDGYAFEKKIFPDSLLNRIEAAKPRFIIKPAHYRKIIAVKNRKFLDECKFYTATHDTVSHEVKGKYGRCLWDFPTLDKTIVEQCTNQQLKELQIYLEKKKDQLAFTKRIYKGAAQGTEGLVATLDEEE